MSDGRLLLVKYDEQTAVVGPALLPLLPPPCNKQRQSAESNSHDRQQKAGASGGGSGSGSSEGRLKIGKNGGSF
jgi:hypothetical protein